MKMGLRGSDFMMGSAGHAIAVNAAMVPTKFNGPINVVGRADGPMAAADRNSSDRSQLSQCRIKSGLNSLNGSPKRKKHKTVPGINPKNIFCKCNRTTGYQIIEEHLWSSIIVKLVNEQRWEMGAFVTAGRPSGRHRGGRMSSCARLA